MHTAIMIMAKVPQAGEVKTRLCPPLSPQEAMTLYQAFLRDKIAQVQSLDAASPTIAYTPSEGRSIFAALAPSFTLIAQQGADLGARLANAFAQCFAAGHTGVIAIDSDTPTLPTDFLQQAIALLSIPKVDVVIGPSDDGGYYLIGLRALHHELFENMAWSTAVVASETIRRATAKGLQVAWLPPWFDVDTPEESGAFTVDSGVYAGEDTMAYPAIFLAACMRVAWNWPWELLQEASRCMIQRSEADDDYASAYATLVAQEYLASEKVLGKLWHIVVV